LEEGIRWKFGTEKRGKIMNGDYHTSGSSNEDREEKFQLRTLKNSRLNVESTGEARREGGNIKKYSLD